MMILLFCSIFATKEILNKEKKESQNSVLKTSSSSKKEIMLSESQDKKDIVDPIVHPWNKPSEIRYPVINDLDSIRIEVSIENQRVYIFENEKVVYTMICSTGDSAAGTPTPTGDFYIEPERGEKFYWAEDNDWAYKDMVYNYFIVF